MLKVHDVTRWERVLRFLGKKPKQPSFTDLYGTVNPHAMKAAIDDARRTLGLPPDHFDLSKRERGWMGTYTGRRFFPLDPRAEDVDIRDIARGLSMTCRYAGQVKRFYSVAEHCYHVSVHVDQQFAREGLLHDSSEAYIGDMIRPLKHQPEMQEFRRAEASIEYAVTERFGLRAVAAHEPVKEIDNRILVDEIMALSACPEYYLVSPGLGDVAPLGIELSCWSPTQAEKMFLHRYEELFGARVPR